MKYLFLTLMCTMACATMQSQTCLTLEECRQMALEHNAKMQQSKLNIAATQEQKKKTFTKYFPTISATGLGFNANKDMLSIQLQPGVEMSMLKDGITASVTAMQPVFAGGQIVNGNKLARLGVRVSQLQMEQTEDEVRRTVENYYWQIVSLREKMRTVEVVDSMLVRLSTDVETSVNAGVALRNDLLQVQLKRNDVASTLLNLENNMKLCQMLLAQYIGAETTEVEPTEHVIMGEMPKSPTDLLTDHQAALPSTPEYRLLQSNVEASNLQRKITIGENLPSVAVGAGFMYNHLLDQDRSFGLVLATVNVPLSGWWGGSHAIKRSKLQMENARISLNDNSQLLVIGMQNAWNEVENAYRQLSIACRSIEQSAENLRLNNDYYHAGISTMSDLMEAQSMYQQSRDKYVESYADYQTKRTAYLIATGR